MNINEAYDYEEVEEFYDEATLFGLVEHMTLFEYTSEYFVRTYDAESNFIGWDYK